MVDSENISYLDNNDITDYRLGQVEDDLECYSKSVGVRFDKLEDLLQESLVSHERQNAEIDNLVRCCNIKIKTLDGKVNSLSENIKQLYNRVWTIILIVLTQLVIVAFKVMFNI